MGGGLQRNIIVMDMRLGYIVVTCYGESIVWEIRLDRAARLISKQLASYGAIFKFSLTILA